MKQIYTFLPICVYCSQIVIILKIPSLVPFPLMKPLWNSSTSISCLFLFSTILSTNFSTWLIKLIVRCCEHSVAFGFLGNLTRMESAIDCGMSPSLQIIGKFMHSCEIGFIQCFRHFCADISDAWCLSILEYSNCVFYFIQ